MIANFDLRDAIEGLYSAFAGYPLPKNTDPCWHCHSEDDEKKIHMKPLRDLEVEDLREYACDALLVWGDENTFKHLLPRIFELFLTIPNPTLQLIDGEILFSKFRHGMWRAWPEAEQNAVEHFLHAIWAHALESPQCDDHNLDTEAWLCMIAQCEDKLEPYLRYWIADDRLPASLALSSLIRISAVTHSKKAGRNPFWDGRDAQYAELQRWVRSPEVAKKLYEAKLACEDVVTAEELGAALAMCSAE